VELDIAVAGGFLLSLARTSAWVMAAPVFGSRGMGSVGRLALALALSMFLAPLAARSGDVPTDIVEFAVTMVGQVIVGLLLGWATGLVVHAVEAAGAAIDLAGGFTIGSLIDPFTGNQSALFARFANLVFVTLLFASNAHELLMAGFVRSFEAVPADRFPVLGADTVAGAASAVGLLLVVAIEIGAPVLGVLFLTEVALGLAARFAPQANVFMLGMPLKALVTFGATGAALVFLPGRIGDLVRQSIDLGTGLLR
jgi:flagellar biosynthetic protein FliR